MLNMIEKGFKLGSGVIFISLGLTLMGVCVATCFKIIEVYINFLYDKKEKNDEHIKFM